MLSITVNIIKISIFRAFLKHTNKYIVYHVEAMTQV